MIFKFVFIKISLFVLINTILQLKTCIKTILIYIILMYMKFNMKFNNLDKISKQIIYSDCKKYIRIYHLFRNSIQIIKLFTRVYPARFRNIYIKRPHEISRSSI